MAKIVYENDIKELLVELSKKAEVFAPALLHPHSAFSQFGYTKVTQDTQIELSAPTTILPPKEFLLPAEEVRFSYDGKELKEPKLPKQILFGVSMADMEGLFWLKKFFEKPVKDEGFLEKIEKTIIVGVDNFSPPKDVPFDLYLMRIGSGVFAAFSGTKAGAEITKTKYFKNKTVIIPKVKQKKDQLLTDPDLAKIIERSKGSKVWDELAKACFGCGICSYVCPMCYCFDEKDRPQLGKEEGTRIRTWDSCLLSGFAETSAENFRSELRDRIYNWYYHKFVRMPAEYGHVGCVDCNRCIIYCPAKINYQNVLLRLIKETRVRK